LEKKERKEKEQVRAKQPDMPGMPAPAGAAKKALEYIDFKEDLEAKEDSLDKRKAEVKEAMKEAGVTTLKVTSPETKRPYLFTLKKQEKLSVTREREGFKKS
jgi:hypothetical protein